MCVAPSTGDKRTFTGTAPGTAAIRWATNNKNIEAQIYTSRRAPRRAPDGILSAMHRADIATRLSRASALALALGAAVGAWVVFTVAPRFRWFFTVPEGGVGLGPVTQYPQGDDDAVIVA